MVQYIFRPRKPEGSLGRTAQRTATSTLTQLLNYDSRPLFFFHVALRPRRRDGILGTGTEYEWEGDDTESEGSTAETARKRPERPWTAARTMELVLRRCPLAIAQRLVHCAFAVSTAVLAWTVTKTMSVALLLMNNLDNSKRKRGSICSAQFHLPTHDLFWANLRVQLHLPPLRSLDLAWNPACPTTVGYKIL